MLSSTWAAFRDPILRPFRRELRWTLYRRGKALAAENLMAGRRLAALRFAFQAWLVDPREIADLILLVRAICERNIEARLNRLRRYTTAALASQAR